MSKVALVTGATGGIGYETARALAEHGFRILLHGRTEDKAAAARERILAERPGADIEVLAADLGEFAAVWALAAGARAKIGRLDVLVNNAGVWNAERKLNSDGVEKTFAINHLAYFLLAAELLPLMDKTGRIICVSSDSHKQIPGMFFGDVNLTDNYHGLRSYAQSKLANVLFTYEYERRRDPAQHPAIFAVQPGLVQTDIGLKGNGWIYRLGWRVRRRMSGSKTPAQGAATSVYLATALPQSYGTVAADAPELISGKYWDDCRVKPSYSSSYDSEEAARLWALSESLTGTSFL